MLSSRISFSDFDRITSLESDLDDLLSRSSEPSSVPDEDSEDFFVSKAFIPKPSNARVDLFISRNGALSRSASYVRCENAPRDRYDLNWCSVEDYVENWDLLSRAEKHDLHLLISSDTLSNRYRFGLKSRNLETHLLLNLGCDMTNILGSKTSSISSNLKSPSGLYSRECVDSRGVDAKTCLKAYDKFKRERDVEVLFKSGLVCYQAVISSDSSYRKLSRDISESKKSYQEFFRLNAEFLAYLAKRKKVVSYAYSHEISVDSILSGDYRPHTHIMLFVEKSHSPREQGKLMLELESELSNALSDRTLSFVTEKGKKNSLPLKVDNYEEIAGSFNYFFRAYSLADQYMREIRDSNVRELNLKTREAYRNLIYLLKSEDANGSKGVRRFRSSNIPKKGEEFNPLLQKESKKRKIKKKKVCANIQDKHEQETSPSTPEECSRENQSSETPEAASKPQPEALSQHALGWSAGNSGRFAEFWSEHGGLLRWRRTSHVLGSFQDSNTSGRELSCTSARSQASSSSKARLSIQGCLEKHATTHKPREQKCGLQQPRGSSSEHSRSSRPGGHFSISKRSTKADSGASRSNESVRCRYECSRAAHAPTGSGRPEKKRGDGAISGSPAAASSRKQQHQGRQRRRDHRSTQEHAA